MKTWIALALALAACGKRAPREADPAPPRELPGDGGAPPGDAAAGWPELEGLPRVEPAYVVALPVKPDIPRFSVGGPVIAGDLAIVSSSQFGFLAVDWRRGTIAWAKPAGLYVAPPLIAGEHVVLVGACFSPPAVAAGERLLGCLRVVSPAGIDQAYMPIRGAAAAVEPFAAAPGTQSLWLDGDRTIRWRRGERAVAVDLLTGAAKPAASIAPPPIPVVYKGKRWDLEHVDEQIVARSGSRVAWQTEGRYTALVGIVWLPESSPMVRIANLGNRAIRLIDMDATGSLATASGRPMPGIGLLAWATSSVGDAALAIRLDRSLRRDFVAGYAANAMVMWVHPLPEVPRPDPIGVAVAPEAVVIFHDGDTLTILPELSAPPTSPGAVRAASQNPTP